VIAAPDDSGIEDGDQLAFVDAHHHLQDLEANHYPWLTDKSAPPRAAGDLSAIRRSYSLDDLKTDVATLRLQKSVHIQNGWNPNDPVGETRWLQNLADLSGFPNAIVAFADLSRPDIESHLEAHAQYPNLRGVRQLLAWHEDPLLAVAKRSDLMSDAAWRRGFAALRRFDLSFDLQIFPPQAEMACTVAKAYPDITIALDHMGSPVDSSPSGLELWAAAIKRLAQAPNIFAKLSGFGILRFDWTIEQVAPLVLRVIDAFGVDRCMVGTNLPFDRLFGPPERIVGMVRWIAEKCGPSDADKVLRANAEKFYRM
jgi:predicted TIM-barrel fold metal-dependent hydrolase